MTVPLDLHTIEAEILRFFNSPEHAAPIAHLRRQLPDEAVVYVVGGAIRNFIMTRIWGQAPPTEDIDVFIGNLPENYPLDQRFKGEAVEHTELDGLRWMPTTSSFVFDLCLLPKFVVLQRYRLPPTLENLLGCIDFSINASVLDINAGILHERQCVTAIKNRLMGFNTHRFYTKQLLAYRVLLIRHKIGFAVSQSVFSFLKHQLALPDLADLNSLFRSKLGKRRTRELMADYDRICSFRTYAEYQEAIRQEDGGIDASIGKIKD